MSHNQMGYPQNIWHLPAMHALQVRGKPCRLQIHHNGNPVADISNGRKGKKIHVTQSSGLSTKYMASTCCAHSASQGKTMQAADPPQHTVTILSSALLRTLAHLSMFEFGGHANLAGSTLLNMGTSLNSPLLFQGRLVIKICC